MHQVSHAPQGNETYVARKRVYWDGSATSLERGDVTCYNRDVTTDVRGTTEEATAFGSGRFQKVEEPSIANITDFAGLVAMNYSATTLARCKWIEILVPQIGSVLPVQAKADCTIKKTVLGPVPGYRKLRPGVLFPEAGVAFLALQTVDRSSTTGEVEAAAISAEGYVAKKSTEYFFRDFISAVGPYAQDAELADESDPVGEFSEVADRGEWHVTVVDDAPGEAETIVIKDAAPGGWLVVTTNTTANDNMNAQLNGSMFKMAEGTPLYFEAYLKDNDVDEVNLWIGLDVEGTTDVYGAPGNDHIGFRCDHDAALDFTSDKDGGGPTADTDIATLADGEAVKVAFLWDGFTEVKYFVDDALIDTINTSDDDISDDEDMSPVFQVETSGGAADSIEIDYIDIRNALATPRHLVA